MPRSTRRPATCPHDNYTTFCHYDAFSFGAYSESICSGPAGKPHGQGEFIWWVDNTPQGVMWIGHRVDADA